MTVRLWGSRMTQMTRISQMLLGPRSAARHEPEFFVNDTPVKFRRPEPTEAVHKE